MTDNEEFERVCIRSAGGDSIGRGLEGLTLEDKQSVPTLGPSPSPVRTVERQFKYSSSSEERADTTMASGLSGAGLAAASSRAKRGKEATEDPIQSYLHLPAFSPRTKPGKEETEDPIQSCVSAESM